MESRYIRGKSVARKHAAIEKAVEELAIIRRCSGFFLIGLRVVLGSLLFFSTIRFGLRLGPDADGCLKGANAIAFQFTQKD